MQLKPSTVNVACPSEDLAQALTTYLDQAGHTVIAYRYRAGVMVTTDAPVEVVNVACQAVTWGYAS